MKRIFAIAILSLSLAGCGSLGSTTGGPGNTAASLGADGTFSYSSSKDFAKISGKFTRPDGMSGEFSAEGVDATSSLKLAAEAMKAQSDAFKSILDQLGPLLKGVAGGAGGIPLSPRPR